MRENQLNMQVYRGTVAVHCVVCPAGFTHNVTVSKCYIVSAAKVYSQAGPECQRLDSRAHLIVITSQAEMDAIAAVIAANNGQCYLMHCFRPVFSL